MRGDTLVSCARPRSRARPFRSLAWGDAISRPLVLPTGAVEARRHEPKNLSEGFGLCFVYQHHDNHDSGGLFNEKLRFGEYSSNRTPHCLSTPRVHFRTLLSIFLVRSHQYMNEVATRSITLSCLSRSRLVSPCCFANWMLMRRSGAVHSHAVTQICKWLARVCGTTFSGGMRSLLTRRRSSVCVCVKLALLNFQCW
jgi:hypothetical protein